VLKDQLAFQYAALDCWKAVADNLPAELTLESINFGERKVTYFGTGPSDEQGKVYDLNEAMGKFKVNGRNFSRPSIPRPSTRWEAGP